MIEPRKLSSWGRRRLSIRKTASTRAATARNEPTHRGPRARASWYGFPRNLGDPVTSDRRKRRGNRTNPRPWGVGSTPQGANKEPSSVQTAQGKRGRLEG